MMNEFILTKLFFFAKRLLSAMTAFFFLTTSIFPSVSIAQTLPQTILNLPIPGSVVATTAGFTPAMIKGVNLYPDNPLKFDFIIDKGDAVFTDEAFKKESTKLIKYFLSSLTVPEDEMWVNLSPYEKNRIVPQDFGKTEMGRDLLAQDYMLKQLTASLMNPDDKLGGEFWQRVYSKAQEKYGTTDIPMNTFNKIWIVPEKAVVYEHEKGAFVVKSHLKVLLEEDYLALDANKNSTKHGLGDVKADDLKVVSGVQSAIIKDLLIPEIEKEVNEGKTFTNLRQIYNAVILASWYKQALKESLLGQVYIDQKKTKGVETTDKTVNEQIYNQYVESFKKGVYNTIKEDYNPETQEVVNRKYFSGGVNFNKASLATESTLDLSNPDLASVAENSSKVEVDLASLSSSDAAMVSNQESKFKTKGDAASMSSRSLADGINNGHYVIQKDGFIKMIIADSQEAKDLWRKEFEALKEEFKGYGIRTISLDSLRYTLNGKLIEYLMSEKFDSRKIVKLPAIIKDPHTMKAFIEAMKIIVNDPLSSKESLLRIRSEEFEINRQLFDDEKVEHHLSTILDTPGLNMTEKLAYALDSMNTFGEEGLYEETINFLIDFADGSVGNISRSDRQTILSNVEALAAQIDRLVSFWFMTYNPYLAGFIAHRGQRQNQSVKGQEMEFVDPAYFTFNYEYASGYANWQKDKVFTVVVPIASIVEAYDIKDEDISDIVIKEGVYSRASDVMMNEEVNVDSALMSSQSIDKTTKGGIDLNPTILSTEIKRNSRGVIIPTFKSAVPDLNGIEGFVPNIINVTPITNLQLLLGLDTKSKENPQNPQNEKPVDVSFNLSALPAKEREEFNFELVHH